MLFNSIEYLLFLAIAWTLFWTVPTRHRVTVLLLASYAFYASWSAPYAAMVFGLVIVNYLFGLVLGRTRRHRRRAPRCDAGSPTAAPRAPARHLVLHVRVHPLPRRHPPR